MEARAPGAQLQSAVLTTKVRIPLVRRRLVARPRLTAKLDGVWQVPVVLLSAPAGFGKTTLLARWARTNSGRVAWVSLEPGDNDPAKLFEVIWTLDLAEKLDAAEVTANCLHPGWPLKTGLHRQANGGFGIFLRLTQLFASTAAKGAETSIHLASAPELAGVSGRYFANSHEATVSDLAGDPTVRRRVVELSARLCGLTAASPGL